MSLPSPRLQLRWRRPTARELARRSIGFANDQRWTCVYELVLPLRDGDCRRKKKSSEAVIRLGRTFTSTGRVEPPDYAPFRDGAHALWDSEALRGIPVFIIGADGSAKEHSPLIAEERGT